MIKKTITYTDFDGVEKTEDFYFNYTESELVDMELTKAGGYEQMLTRIANAKDVPSIIREFKNIIMTSYGEKSADGRYFLKKKDGVVLGEVFCQSAAYDKLYMELASDAKKFEEFINALVPESVRKKAEAAAKAQMVPSNN